jgi:predicted amidophosphoribosyltransferase
MKCPNCQADVASYDKICPQCGEDFFGAFEYREEDSDEELTPTVQVLLPCPACGAQSFTHGEVVGQYLKFNSTYDRVLDRMFSSCGSLPARVCDSCGHIQLFVKRLEES